MPPLLAQPAAHCSVTRMRFLVGLPGASCGPHRARNVPIPASSSSLLVAGDCHVTCCTRCTVCSAPLVSGEVVAVRPPRPATPITAPDDGCSRHPVEPKYAAPLQGTCSSQ